VLKSRSSLGRFLEVGLCSLVGLGLLLRLAFLQHLAPSALMDKTKPCSLSRA